MIDTLRKYLQTYDGDLTMLPDEELLEYLTYTIAHEQTLAKIEAQLHSVENPEEIAMYALKAAAEFYDGDWCGSIEGDLDVGAWAPVLWYNRATDGMTATTFKDMEETEALERWVNAVYNAEPIVIRDTSVVRDINPAEYAIYERLEAKSVLAVPFWKNPVGFLIVRNPKRFADRCSFLQALAYVVFSSSTEKKLIERSQRVITPEQIQSDRDVVINVFGHLEICTSKGMITEDDLNSPKMSRYLVYLLLNRGGSTNPAYICEEIWPDKETDNPASTAKNMAFRMQSIFSQVSPHRLLVPAQPGYQLNPELNIITDIDRFEEYLTQAENALTLQAREELLKSAIDLYDVGLFRTASSEHWIMAHELGYKYKCLGVFNELLKLLYDKGDYSMVQYYAAKALKIEKANVDAYYWLIRCLQLRDSATMVKGEMQLARHALSQEEFQDLTERLEKAG